MVDTGLRILVVGAGIAGLAATRALRLAGFRPELVEKLPASVVPGAGIYLPGNAARALRALDLYDAVRPFGAVITRQSFRGPAGELLAEVDVADLWADAGECRALPRADLQRVLLSGAGGAVRHEIAVSGLELVDGSAKVDFSDGARAEYDLLVAADGRRSAVRAMAGLGGAAHPVGQLVYRAVVAGVPSVEEWSVWLGSGTSFLAMPLGDGRVYCYVTELAARADRRAGRNPEPPADPPARVRELAGGYGGPVPELLDRMDKVQVAAIDEVELPTWVRGSVVLIGDAAHASSPTLSQGAAMALEDAVALAEELCRVADVPAGLAAFEARRLPRTAWVLSQTRRRDRPWRRPTALHLAALRRRGAAAFRAAHAPLVGAP